MTAKPGFCLNHTSLLLNLFKQRFENVSLAYLNITLTWVLLLRFIGSLLDVGFWSAIWDIWPSSSPIMTNSVLK